MREIKFRAWCKAKKKLYEVYSISKYEIVVYDISNQKEYLCEDCELMQYTGLKDKNGVEIYEGDVVEMHSKLAHTKTRGGIFYEERACAFMIDDNIFKQYIPITVSDDIEVIGNIHENPELLEQK